ncbi:DUF4190 domain-containing protein [Kitasatospora sp. MBT63]|uniref:DUF4190 domain-containing protein n=1 Tax=Kitasatospora sp. MBT63 TaxID=1444768 RepID=UPI000690D20C|nr:DUF4190 domain-containing protein [Kitasatospora sp. MBT63]
MSNPYQSPDPYGGYGPPQQQPYGTPPPSPYQQPVPPPVQQPAYGYPQQPYPPQPQPYFPPQPAAEPNSMATAAMALGFAGIVICFYGAMLGPIGLGLGIAGLNRAQKTGVGRTQAIGGIALSTLAILIGIAGLVFYDTLTKNLP